MEFTQETFIVRLPERMDVPADRVRLIACNAHDVVGLSDRFHSSSRYCAAGIFLQRIREGYTRLNSGPSFLSF